MNRQQILKLLGEKRGEFERGLKNSITDVKGVIAGHLTINKDLQGRAGEKISIRTGLTAVIPCDMKEEKRLFAGCFPFRSKNEITGYEVTEDFCYLNSPVVISNSYNVGRVYNAILSYGFSLGRTEIWPPVVLGMDDSWLNDMTRFSMDEKQILRLFHDSSKGRVEEGSVGIGLGLRAFNWKGGVGTSSRILTSDGEQNLIGVLAASNHGNKNDSEIKKSGVNSDSKAEGSLILILAVDLPLVPFQIKQITSSIVVSLPPVNILNNFSDSVTCLLFSTANAMSMENEGPSVFDYSLVNDSALERIVKAGAEAVTEAICRSLLLSAPVQGRLGRKIETIPGKEAEKLLREFEGPDR